MLRLLFVLLLLWPAIADAAGSVNVTGSCPGVTVGSGDSSIGCQADTITTANSLNDFANKYNRHWHEYTAATLTNQTGGGLVAGDVVALSTANDAAVATNDSQTSRRLFVVAMGTISSAAAGEFARSGIVSAKAQGAIARGDYVRKSATAKAIETTSTAMGTDTALPDGSIGIALAAASGGFVNVYLFGRTVTADALVAGANVTLTPGTRQTTIASSAGGGLTDANYLFNASFEIFGTGTGTSAPPTGWAISTGQMNSPGKDTTNIKYGLAAAAVQRTGGVNAKIIQNAVTAYPPATSWRSQAVVFGCWVRATVASRARLGIDDGVGSANSSYHTGGSAFEWLTVSRTLDASATKVEVQLLVDSGNTTAQFDGCVLTKGSVAPSDYFPESWRGRKAIMSFGSAATGLSTNPTFYGIGANTTENRAMLPVPFVRAVVRNLTVKTDANTSVTDTLRYNAADTTITCTFSSNTTCSDLTHEVEVAQTGLLVMKSTETGTIFHNATVEIEEIP